jgi:uncharacterized protein
MIVDVVSLKDGQTSFDFQVAPGEIDLEGEPVKLKDAVKIQGELKKGIAQTDVRGEISGEIQVECNRCLQDARMYLELDLTELAREQILLNLPSQVFCREDCQGLCQKCGANLNLIDCSCEESEVDPRWAALRNLK